MNEFRKLVTGAYEKAARKREEFDAQRAALEAESKINDQERRRFAAHCRLANASDYGDWLKGYIRRGGRPTHTYERSLTTARTVVNGGIGGGMELRVSEGAPDWMVMCEPPSYVPSLYGAGSFNVIVPCGIGFGPRDVPRTFHGGCGHSSFYFMDGFEWLGLTVPLFTDVAAYLLDGES